MGIFLLQKVFQSRDSSCSSQKLRHNLKRLYETFTFEGAALEEGSGDEEHAGLLDSLPAAKEYFKVITAGT